MDDYVKNSSRSVIGFEVDVAAYKQFIGKILNLTITRPNIAYNVQTLSQFLQQPKKSHLEVAIRIVRYVEQQSRQEILLSSSRKEQVLAYCDADWQPAQTLESL